MRKPTSRDTPTPCSLEPKRIVLLSFPQRQVLSLGQYEPGGIGQRRRSADKPPRLQCPDRFLMALSGTEGSYDIYHGDAQVCHVYWCAPYLSGKKAFEISSVNGDYEVEDPRGGSCQRDTIAEPLSGDW